MFFVRMIRLIPLIAVLLLVAVIIYLVAQAKYSPDKAKSIVIKVFLWITAILTVIFLLACIYALLDKNMAVFELFLSFAAVPAAGFAVTLVCRAVFLKHHPPYRDKAMKSDHSETFKSFWSRKIKEAITKYLRNKLGK